MKVKIYFFRFGILSRIENGNKGFSHNSLEEAMKFIDHKRNSKHFAKNRYRNTQLVLVEYSEWTSKIIKVIDPV